eukprot:364512-Chlamydomonas_euryale.AAC.10
MTRVETRVERRDTSPSAPTIPFRRARTRAPPVATGRASARHAAAVAASPWSLPAAQLPRAASVAAQRLAQVGVT